MLAAAAADAGVRDAIDDAAEIAVADGLAVLAERDDGAVDLADFGVRSA